MADRSFFAHATAGRCTGGIWLACLAVACEPKLVVGSFSCTSDAGVDAVTEIVTMPWSSGFEDGACGYTRVGGFCYTSGDASYEFVTSPVRSGARAAAFRIETGATPDGAQARCVRQGELPAAAYYGAWYYIAGAASDLDNWNLFHFQGGDGAGPLRGLWDVTVTADAAGSLRLSVYDFLRSTWRHAAAAPDLPIGAWFHIQVYLQRAADATGAFALYQDGQLLVELRGLVTDDSTYGQWYVGNLARSLAPPASTLYVDDVTIQPSL